MSLNGKQVSVGTSATKIADAGSAGVRPGASILVVMVGTGPIFLHGDDTVDSTKFSWDKTVLAAITVQLEQGEELWGKVASGSTSVHVLESGV